VRARDADGLLRGGGRGQEPRVRARRAGGAAVSRRRFLLAVVPLALAGVGATYVPWEDLTEDDWLFAVATRVAIVDGRKVHYPTPTAELAQALEARAETGALRHLADARLALGDRAGAVAAREHGAEA